MERKTDVNKSAQEGKAMEAGRKLLGVGCFAKPSTLARVLKKAVEAYVMAPIETVDAITRSRQYRNQGTQWLRHLISGQSDVADAGREEWMWPGAINGFFLGVERQSLKLSIFTGGRHLTASLDEVTALRRKHLH